MGKMKDIAQQAQELGFERYELDEEIMFIKMISRGREEWQVVLYRDGSVVRYYESAVHFPPNTPLADTLPIFEDE